MARISSRHWINSSLSLTRMVFSLIDMTSSLDFSMRWTRRSSAFANALVSSVTIGSLSPLRGPDIRGGVLSPTDRTSSCSLSISWLGASVVSWSMVAHGVIRGAK
ncbi:hypothetical protein K450DRAFT_226889 [Umbelopsis ramanniana AG]|uniref:Uncharacterized protein n=1 Tax=Umbelopsis ramanniana AG TaxID=1314678 RepID=A0AAD5HFS8_UMBRA|nr:uncharacterized protein K450DRAFT_226889 [Umbelopsis ramanniana AG]KAI8582782.1 hypothetical protein K450DRAFT_226889 [Umbelopsis ramanniana AG]